VVEPPYGRVSDRLREQVDQRATDPHRKEWLLAGPEVGLLFDWQLQQVAVERQAAVDVGDAQHHVVQGLPFKPAISAG